MRKHRSGPWLRKSTGCYYVQVNGKQRNLGRDKAAAQKKWHALRAGETVNVDRVDAALDAFLEYVRVNKSPTTFTIYQGYCKSFNESIPGRRVSALKVGDVQRWLDSQTGWNNTTKGIAGRCIKSAFKWYTKMGHVTVSPLAEFQPPTGEPRETIYTADQWQTILAAIKDRPFRELMIVMQATGCRPFEARIVEAKHVEGDRWVFPRVNSKGKKYRRVVHVDGEALEIVRRRCEEFPTGPIFRNRYKKPWTKNAVSCRCKRLSKKLKFPVFAYALRHSFCTDLLTSGVDSTAVADLMGHRDKSMIGRVYSHLDQKADFLREQLKRRA